MLSMIGLFLVILIAMFMGDNGVVGYSSSSRLLSEYPYEGFESIQNAFERRYGEAFTNEEEEEENKEGFEASESPPLKVTGFSGLMSRAYTDEKIIGFMYNNESGANCKPYGYTNSKGNICLSDSDIRLLTTRGGNASGPSDQIGK